MDKLQMEKLLLQEEITNLKNEYEGMRKMLTTKKKQHDETVEEFSIVWEIKDKKRIVGDLEKEIKELLEIKKDIDDKVEQKNKEFSAVYGKEISDLEKKKSDFLARSDSEKSRIEKESKEAKDLLTENKAKNGFLSSREKELIDGLASLGMRVQEIENREAFVSKKEEDIKDKYEALKSERKDLESEKKEIDNAKTRLHKEEEAIKHTNEMLLKRQLDLDDLDVSLKLQTEDVMKIRSDQDIRREQTNELIANVEKREAIMDKMIDEYKTKEIVNANKDASLKEQQRQLDYKEATYQEKYNQFLLTLKKSWLKL